MIATASQLFMMREVGQVAPVSVVIPCYNCASSIERAVASVTSQTIRPGELILVDDASTDRTRDVIAEMQKRYGADWLRVVVLEHNGGPATARNAGWDAARYQYVAFLDADDAWHQKKIETQLAYMQSNPDVVLTSHGCRVIRPGERQDADPETRGVRNLTRGSLLVSNRVMMRTVMLIRELPYRFKNGKRYAEDYLLWLQMACDGRPMVSLEAELCYVFKPAFGDSGLSASLWKMEKGELEVFWQLAKEKRSTYITAIFCSVFSLLKYIRRVVIVTARKLRIVSRLHA